MRALGVDFGARRVGVAVSDATGLLARPLTTLLRPAGAQDDWAVGAVITTLASLEADAEPISAIVVGWPRRLDGSPNDQTRAVEAFAALLRRRASRPVHLQDERLSSHEAEARLAVRQRDWRKRKAHLDAAAAAIILQDYLDSRPAGVPTRVSD